MATDKKPAKKVRLRKTPESVRERADKRIVKKETTTHKLKGKIHRPLSVLRRVGQKEYHPVPVPDNKVGRVLKKRVRIMPRYIRESWAELKLVTWPSKKEAARLTGAVVIFAVIFAVVIQLLDVVFNKLFKIIFIK